MEEREGRVLRDVGCPRGVEALLAAFAEAGQHAYLVGGCVRDVLMSIRPHDWDVAVTTVPEETQTLCELRGWRTLPTGMAHGTVTVLVPDASSPRGYEPVECTTCRREGGYSDGRHPDAVSFTNRLSDDLSRRDFTVNAMAAEARADGDFDLIDLYGGREDIENRILRCVGDPETRLTEDALRILRAVRFASRLGFALDPATEDALRKTAPGLSRISRERVRTELLQILNGRDPRRGLSLLDALGLTPYVLPAGVGPGAHDTEGLPALPAEDVPRLCFLLDGLPAAAVRKNLDSLRLPTETVRSVISVLDGMTFVRAAFETAPGGMPPSPPAPTAGLPLLARRLRRMAGGLALCVTDLLCARGENAAPLAACVRASETSGDCVSIASLAVGGRDLAGAGIPPGRETGETLTALLDAVIADPSKNTRDTLLALASAYKTQKNRA